MGSPVTAVNKILKANGRHERLVKGRGYYYLLGYSGGHPGLYECKLEDTPMCHAIALSHAQDSMRDIGIELKL